MIIPTPLIIPKTNKVILPEVKQIPYFIETLMKENNFNPGDKDLIPENCGYWYDEFRKNRELFEFGWPTAIYSRKISPYNKLDERFLVAEMYFNGEDHEITTHFHNENGEKERYRKFRVRGQINESKLNKLFKMVENRYQDILKTRKESEELRENFNFDKFMDNIVSRENKAKEEYSLLENAEKNSLGKKLSKKRRTNIYGKIIYG